ncbi:heavy-metal-associated domain-containing protein [Marisediminicola senii]|uniref:heavy-metal-associated domain-containing protein n=1 Tax=Marisediminicola senii TaxID=2711233 RepID=UPI0013ECD418|nr:heavy-metal-associated domain-containing protein [Marisediminicola senii]
MCSTTSNNDLVLTDKDHNCSCGTDAHAHAHAAAPTTSNTVREHYLVDGMTCGHCVSSVTEEVSEIDGVESVSVDLNVGGSSRVMVVSAQPIAAELIDAAITEAGYQLAPSR